MDKEWLVKSDPAISIFFHSQDNENSAVSSKRKVTDDTQNSNAIDKKRKMENIYKTYMVRIVFFLAHLSTACSRGAFNQLPHSTAL